MGLQHVPREPVAAVLERRHAVEAVGRRLKKEASIVCHGASGEKLCCASKQEHCCIYDEGAIKPLFITTLVVVIILGAFLILQCWRWSRPEPSPLRASSAAPPPPEPAPVAQAEIVPYPNR